MVCFDILLAYPQNEKDIMNTMNEKRLEHIRRVHNADFCGGYVEDNICYVRLRACNLDAAGLLKDIPPLMYCVWVNILRTDIVLYSFFKVTQEKVIPPRNLLLKEVYWAASQLEPRYTRASKA